jgi:GTP-binding protein EngB required for normal cell division
MQLPFPVRLLVALGISLALAVLLLVLLYATDLAFAVWQRLAQVAPWLLVAYGALVALFTGTAAVLIWRVLLPKRPVEPESPAGPPTEAEVEARIEQAQESGVDVSAATAELATIRHRRAAGEVYVALFGEISSGKSSLIKALLPDALVEVDPRGGTTREVVHYTWQSPAGDKLILTDLPGLDEPGRTLESLAQAEAQRAHIIVYLVDGDLTRDQYRVLQELVALGKPLLVTLNKMDRYRPEDLMAIRARLTERIAHAERVDVVAVSAGGWREVVVVRPDGREALERRPIPARVDELARSLQRRIDGGTDILDTLRDAAVFTVVARQLDAAVDATRAERAREVVGTYTRRAIVGAMAAISPGSDILIQGYLGYNLVKELCAVYEVPATKLNIDRFLKLAGRHVGKTLPLTLAVAGNALKAFPGVGTLAGGLAHAVAYGLIFDSLGRAVAETLAARGELPSGPALQRFEESLSENLEARARRFARFALTKRSGPAD